ncbi:hypothetical protein BDV28DRAFT_31833 [Aspergillus coremiiformis]|uniref:Uncharacterized protein n=1 Tax=Aspergillus coremiiformis TaxID=138285 RepID=A0A5N6YZC2_9EURO|nr:hypothetical protein BDV28DRAFT_31833 [Aspergillus coremiiformis]
MYHTYITSSTATTVLPLDLPRQVLLHSSRHTISQPPDPPAVKLGPHSDLIAASSSQLAIFFVAHMATATLSPFHFYFRCSN